MTPTWGEDALIEHHKAVLENRDAARRPTGADLDAAAADAVYGQADRTVDSADRFMHLRGAW